MRTKIQLLLTVLVSMAASSMICESLRAVPPELQPWVGHQRQSDGSGGHSGSSSGDADNSQQAERDREYDAVNRQVNDAWNRHDYREALRLLKQQKKLRNGPNVRKCIKDVQALIVWSDATTVAEYRRAIKMRPELFSPANVRWVDEFEKRQQDKGIAEQMGQSEAAMAAKVRREQEERQQAKVAAANELSNKAVGAFNEKDWPTAAEYFQLALQNKPNDPYLLEYLACVRDREGDDAYNKGDYTAALEYYKQAAANDPETDRNNQAFHNHLAAAQIQIDNAKREQEQRTQNRLAEEQTRQRHKLNADHIVQSMKNFAQTLSVTPSSDASSVPLNPRNGGDSGGLDLMDSDPNAVGIRPAGTTAVDPAPGNGSSGSSTTSGDLAFMDPSDPVGGAVTDSPSDQTVAHGIFGDNVAKPNLTPRDSVFRQEDTKASDQATSAAAAGQNSGRNFDTGGEKSPQSLNFSPAREAAASIDPATFSKRVKNDPRMKDALKQLDSVKANRSKLNTELDQLTTQMDSEKNAEKMAELAEKVQQKNKEKQVNLLEITKAEETVKKTKRRIDTEVDGSPDSKGPAQAAAKN